MQNALTSIAVLPFVNISNDIENEYFSDGITEEIINALTQIKDLKVIARTSSFVFKGKQIDVRKVGKQLNVTTLLQGSVRKASNRVRITAQLIDTKEGTHYWSKNFDKELIDIFSLQDEVSLLIANEVRNNFGHFEIQERLVKTTTNSVAAYESFLKGRSYQLQWTPESIQSAITYYNKAIELDQTYAKAYYANLQCYGLLATWGFMPEQAAMDLAISNFLKAKELDTQLPEYPLSFVGRTFWGEWDFKAAHGYIEQVLAINPNHIDGLEAMAELYIAHGFFKEALQYAERLIAVDPLSANNLYTLAHIYYYKKEFKKALEIVKKALLIRPGFELANHLYVICLIWLKKTQEFQDAIHSLKDSELYELLYNVIHHKKTKLSSSWLAQNSDITKITNRLAPLSLFILANSSYQKKALDLLTYYVTQKRGQIINYKQEPLLASLHSFTEFQSLYESNLLYADITKDKIEKPNPNPSLSQEEQVQFRDRLKQYFTEFKPYLNPQLSLSILAEELQMHPNKLSFLINEVMQINFNEFLNYYRLTHFKKLAVNPKLKHITILGLAYDSGFNSKSVFNTYFKKAEGITPSQWVKNNS